VILENYPFSSLEMLANDIVIRMPNWFLLAFSFFLHESKCAILGQVVGYTYTSLAEFGSGFITG